VNEIDRAVWDTLIDIWLRRERLYMKTIDELRAERDQALTLYKEAVGNVASPAMQEQFKDRAR
jgi:hypothetical protein